MFKQRYENRLILQRQAGLYRNPPEFVGREGKYLFKGDNKILNFASNDYLGLSTSLELREKTMINFKKYGTSSSSSRLVSGNYSIINQAEESYAKYFGYEDALFFPSGYQANIGALSTFFERGDTVIFDKHIHASSVKGIKMSGADFYGYNHNSLGHLEKRLKLNKGKDIAVLTESLFSMDGDLLDVAGICTLKERYGFLLVVDEAHSFGAIGEKGRGLASGAADIAVGTFGKALGFFGAFVLLPKMFKEYLFNFSSPLIYTTTLPEAHAATTIDILKMIHESDDKRARLTEVAKRMKNSLREEGFSVSGEAHILAVEIGDETKTLLIARNLLEKGIFVLPARYPTVPLQRAILRVGITANHDEEDIELFVDSLKEVYGKHE